MKPTIAAIVMLPFLQSALRAAELKITSPQEYQVLQRTSTSGGVLTVSGEIANLGTAVKALEARLTVNGEIRDWQKLTATFNGTAFQAPLEVLSGGWYRLEVRAAGEGKAMVETAVEKFGVGEVFVVAGQSNSANHGEEKQITRTARVVTFNGKTWQLGNDPQPGASGGGGSFLPLFGDAMAQRFNVPVGFIACGIGATSVREWLPKGATFPNPPTLESRVRRLPDGRWESNGQAYDHFVSRLKQIGPRGFRAVLWHQGESDANQRDATRTLSGALYREYLEKLIRDSRQAIDWNAPWFVAQVSYHVPGDESSPEIREAQASLWKDGIALPGPDSDAMKSEFRERGGKGVHFNGKGLHEHAARWVEKVAPWLDEQLAAKAAP